MIEGESTCARFVLFLSQDKEAPWYWEDKYCFSGGLFPISDSLPLDTPEAKTISESVWMLLDREWKRRAALGELEVDKTGRPVRERGK